jgi:hypothetical protein
LSGLSYDVVVNALGNALYAATAAAIKGTVAFGMENSGIGVTALASETGLAVGGALGSSYAAGYIAGTVADAIFTAAVGKSLGVLLYDSFVAPTAEASPTVGYRIPEIQISVGEIKWTTFLDDSGEEIGYVVEDPNKGTSAYSKKEDGTYEFEGWVAPPKPIEPTPEPPPPPSSPSGTGNAGTPVDPEQGAPHPPPSSSELNLALQIAVAPLAHPMGEGQHSVGKPDLKALYKIYQLTMPSDPEHVTLTGSGASHDPWSLPASGTIDWLDGSGPKRVDVALHGNRTVGPKGNPSLGGAPMGGGEEWVCRRTLVRDTGGGIWAYCPYRQDPFTGAFINQLIQLPVEVPRPYERHADAAEHSEYLGPKTPNISNPNNPVSLNEQWHYANHYRLTGDTLEKGFPPGQWFWSNGPQVEFTFKGDQRYLTYREGTWPLRSFEGSQISVSELPGLGMTVTVSFDPNANSSFSVLIPKVLEKEPFGHVVTYGIKHENLGPPTHEGAEPISQRDNFEMTQLRGEAIFDYH